ncbi:MAG TPA: hypothetical protein VIJ99_06035 [Acidimicrobiales bacterium]
MSLPTLDTSNGVDCTSCDDNLLHCHGTWIADANGSSVCSDDPDCTLNVDEHWFSWIEDEGISPLK